MMQFKVLRNFSVPSSHFRLRKFQVSFLCEKQLNLGCEMGKIKLRKSQGTYQISLENCSSMKRSSRTFQPSRQVIENSGQFLLLRTDILQKTVAECPGSRVALIGISISCKQRKKAGSSMSKLQQGISYPYIPLKKAIQIQHFAENFETIPNQNIIYTQSQRSEVNF